MPHGALVEDLGERVDVARVEGVISALQDRYVLICSHCASPSSCRSAGSRFGHCCTAESTRHVASLTMTTLHPVRAADIFYPGAVGGGRETVLVALPMASKGRAEQTWTRRPETS